MYKERFKIGYGIVTADKYVAVIQFTEMAAGQQETRILVNGAGGP